MGAVIVFGAIDESRGLAPMGKSAQGFVFFDIHPLTQYRRFMGAERVGFRVQVFTDGGIGFQGRSLGREVQPWGRV